MTQVDDEYVRVRLIWQIVKEISRVLQKLLKHFNGTAISTRFVLSSSWVLPVIFSLDLNNAECAKLFFGSSL